MKHVTKIMIAGWNTGMFISYRREIFSAKTETKKQVVLFILKKTLPVNKLKQICHILEIHF